MGLAGLEPATSALSGQRSNRLSYRPAGRNLTKSGGNPQAGGGLGDSTGVGRRVVRGWWLPILSFWMWKRDLSGSCDFAQDDGGQGSKTGAGRLWVGPMRGSGEAVTGADQI